MKFMLSKLCLLLIAGLCFAAIPLQQVAAQGVNDFRIQTFTADYYLGKDNENRSTLKTVESIIAEFPLTNQNHGIERAIPKSYDGHSTSLKIESITDTSGKPLKYTTYDSDGNEVIRIGDADTYVHGLQTYKLTYTQRDVTRYFADTKSDEFYWDTNGTQWKVPIGLLSATIHLQDGVGKQSVKDRRCYVGTEGSNRYCEVAEFGDGYRVTASALNPYENVTLALGFPAGAFSAHRTTPAEFLAAYAKLMAVLSLPLGLAAFVLLIIRFVRVSDRYRDRTTIVPEYLPPADTSIAVAASISSHQTATFSAQLIDFAVRGYTKIYETRPKSFLRSAQYDIEIVKDISTLKDEEQEIFRDIFPATTVGTRLKMQDLRKNTALYAKVSDNQPKLDKSIRGVYGLRARDDRQTRWFRRAALVLILLAIPLLSFWLAAAALTSLILSFMLYPLTDKGLALWHYLQGLKMYIKTAEADRLRMLQSPGGALKLDVAVDTNDKVSLVKLYEKVLPYAILFGLEKDWNKQLGQYYENIGRSPEWYSGGNTAFNATIFSSSISSFNQAAAYSGAASSSSGGSSGGGSSGGGGGGGGGGGW